MIGALIITIVMLLSYHPRRYERDGTAIYTSRAQEIAELITATTLHALEQHDLDFLRQTLQIARVDSDIVFVALYDASGKPIAVYNPNQRRLPASFFNLDSMVVDKKEMVVVHHEIWAADKSKLGNILLGYSLKELYKIIYEYSVAAVIITFGSLLLGLLIINAVSKRIARPLIELHDQMQESIDSNSFANEVAVRSRDEVGRLTMAFNRMMAELRQRHQSLSEAEEKYRKLVENSPDAIYVHRDGKVLYANPASARLVGASHPQQLIGKSVIDVVAPEHRSVVAERMRRIVQEGITLPFIAVKGIRLDGASLEVETMGLPIIYQGEPAAQVIVRDITERKRVEEALRESEGKFRQLTEHSDEAFCLMTAELKKILYISPAYEKIWNRTCDSLYANPASWLESVLPEDREVAMSKLDFSQNGATAKTQTAEFRLIQPDGAVRWVACRAFPIMNAHGEIFRIGSIAEDITERKQTEEKLHALYHLKSVFVADASHHLFTPLTVIKGEAEVALQQRRASAEYEETLRIILDEAEHLSKVVENLLTLAKADAGILLFLQEGVNFTTICENCIRRSALQAKNKGVQLDHRLEGNCILNGDSMRLAELISNLLDNAVKYTPEGKSIAVILQSTNTHIIFQVTDEGPGINPDESKHIFDRFYRGKFLSKQVKGTGLGLAICASIVKAHGGTIEAQSEVGKGSAMQVTLPKQYKPA